MPKDIHEDLEALIDRHGISRVVSCLSLICDETALRLRTDGQDEASVKAWEADAWVLLRASNAISN